MVIEKFGSVFGNTVKLTQSGIDHMLKRHPELEDINLAEAIGLAIEDPDYIVQGKFGRHIAVRIQPQMKIDKAKYTVVIYEENEEVITSFITSDLERIIRREVLWRRL
jgi:nicotinamide riboside kinase